MSTRSERLAKNGHSPSIVVLLLAVTAIVLLLNQVMPHLIDLHGRVIKAAVFVLLGLALLRIATKGAGALRS